MFLRVLWLLALASPVASGAEVHRAGPADPGATVPALQYPSAFARYRPYQEPNLGAWRDLNDAVAKSPTPSSGGKPTPSVEFDAGKPSAPHRHSH